VCKIPPRYVSGVWENESSLRDMGFFLTFIESPDTAVSNCSWIDNINGYFHVSVFCFALLVVLLRDHVFCWYAGCAFHPILCNAFNENQKRARNRAKLTLYFS